MKRHAVLAIALYLLLGMLGLPVFHNGMAGLGVLMGPTGGYLAGFIPAVLVIGLAYEHPRREVHIIGLVLGTGLIYLAGLLWLIVSTGMGLPAAVMAGMVPFLPGDAVKGVAAYLIAARIGSHPVRPAVR